MSNTATKQKYVLWFIYEEYIINSVIINNYLIRRTYGLSFMNEFYFLNFFLGMFFIELLFLHKL